MEPDSKLLANLVQELKRGTLVLAVLVAAKEPSYGYSLVTELQEAGIDVEQNTLYPLLRRLESQGLMESTWDTEESRPRKYYRVTDAGRATARALTQEWTRLGEVMTGLLAEEET